MFCDCQNSCMNSDSKISAFFAIQSQITKSRQSARSPIFASNDTTFLADKLLSSCSKILNKLFVSVLPIPISASIAMRPTAEPVAHASDIAIIVGAPRDATRSLLQESSK